MGKGGALVGTIRADLVANTARFSAGMAKAGGSVATLGRSVRGLVHRFTGLGALLTGGGMIAGLVKLTRLANEQFNAERKLAAVLQATGGAVGYSADQIKEFASQRQALTNFGDEATIAMAAVLATFKQIRGPVFKDALVAIQDMATVMGTDLKSTALQVGKALADPTARMGELSRAGIVLSDSQKKLVKSLQAAGDMAGAQRVILDELKNEFGGAAIAMADPMVQFKNALGDVGEQLGMQLLPFLRLLGTELTAGLSSGTSSAAGMNTQLGIMGVSIIAITGFAHGLRDAFLEAYLVILKSITGFVWANNELAKMLPKGAIGRINAEEALRAYDAQIAAIEGMLAEVDTKGTWGEQLRENVVKIKAEMEALTKTTIPAMGKQFEGAAGKFDMKKIGSLTRQLNEGFRSAAQSLREAVETPVEAFGRKLKDARMLLFGGLIDEETYARVVKKFRKESLDALPDLSAIAAPDAIGAFSEQARALIARQQIGLDDPRIAIQKEANRKLDDIERGVRELIRVEENGSLQVAGSLP